jgi:ElaA protein
MLRAMESAPAAATVGPPALRWQWSRLPDLAPLELYAVLAERQRVFTVEQHCAFQDADGHDLHAWHLLGWAAAAHTPQLIVYLRAVDAGHRYAEPSIGRVLTTPEHRAKGLGRVVMHEGIARTQRTWPGRRIRIAAQQRLVAFYTSLGFTGISAPYVEDGIVHVDMVLDAV